MAFNQGEFQFKLVRYLFKQHTTVHTTTGKTMDDRLRTALDCLHDDIRQPVTESAKPRAVAANEPVLCMQSVGH